MLLLTSATPQQILKVEIGGDAQSTDGSEPSHAHTLGEMAAPNFHRGYEAWLMVEARKRNPSIKLYGLPWAWPGFLRAGGDNPLLDNTNQTAEYVAAWVAGMRDAHGLRVDYVGCGWNEMDADIKAGVSVYARALRGALDARGLQSTRIVGADGHSFSDITGPMQDDPGLVAVLDVLGAHYPGTHGPGAAGQGKKAWSSEDYSQDAGGVGPACWTRVINRNFVSGNLTATIAWNLVDAYYEGLPFGRNSLMTAHWPWSGHYSVDNPVWASAHTTQFTASGWMYSPVGRGSGWLPAGGTYVTLVPPPGPKADGLNTISGQPPMTMVVEKMDPHQSACRWEGVGNDTTPADETVSFQLHGDLASVTSLQLWSSLMVDPSANGSDVFVKGPRLSVADGRVDLDLRVNHVYTLTTLDQGQKGFFEAIPNISGFFKNPSQGYADNFDSYNISREAAFFSDMAGSWEIVQSRDADHGRVMRQMVPEQPVFGIRTEVRPISLIGESTFVDTIVALDIMMCVR